MKLPRQWGITAVAVAVAFLTMTSISAHAEHSDAYAYRTPLIAATVAASAWALTSNSVQKDKRQHFGVSVASGIFSESLLRSGSYQVEDRWKRLVYATGLATIPGIAKELTDSKFDTGDLLADVIGSFTGAILSDLMQGPVNNFQVGISKDSVKVNWAMHF